MRGRREKVPEVFFKYQLKDQHAPSKAYRPFLNLEAVGEDGRRRVKPFRFLDLPVEVRLQIYGHFAHLPRSDGSESHPTGVEDKGKYQSDRSNARKDKEACATERAIAAFTRRTLRLLCRQINAEFTPIVRSRDR